MRDLEKVRQLYRERGIAGVLRGVERRALLRAVELLKRPLHRGATPDPSHAVFERFVERVNALQRPRVLEIGARARSGNVHSHHFPDADYVGFDVVPGPNVQVVGDAHELSAHFPAGSFDAVFAVSVFEHLAMPWKVVLELNRVLRPGGLACVFTHPTYPPHDRPWDFWRYAPEAFDVLFAPPTGFELVDCAEGLPCAIVPLASAPALVGLWREPAFLAVAALARKIGAPDARLRWDVPLAAVLSTRYPR
jgi:SAM-dependent methyltransferase